MIARTHTNIWTEEKKIYSFYEYQLPTPIGFRSLGIFFLVSIIWIPLMVLLQVPIGTSIGFIVWLGPPIALAILGDKPFFDGKSLFQFASSMVKFAFQPKYIIDGKGVYPQKTNLVVDYGPEEPDSTLAKAQAKRERIRQRAATSKAKAEARKKRIDYDENAPLSLVSENSALVVEHVVWQPLPLLPNAETVKGKGRKARTKPARKVKAKPEGRIPRKSGLKGKK